MDSSASTQGKEIKIPEAHTLLEGSSKIAELVYGSDHPEVARALTGHSTVLADLGEFTAARQALERALSILETAYGPDHPEVARTLTRLETVLAKLRELSRDGE